MFWTLRTTWQQNTIDFGAGLRPAFQPWSGTKQYMNEMKVQDQRLHGHMQYLRLLEDVRRLRRLRNDLLPCCIRRLHKASLQGQERSSSQYGALHDQNRTYLTPPQHAC